METISLWERRRHNAGTPISRLPVEILTEVFYLCIAENFPKKETYEYLERIRDVCSHWSSVASATPNLWAFASSDWPLSKVRRAMRLSQDWPLELKAYGANTVDFLDIVASHAQRWISASLEMELVNDCDHPILHNIDAPRLKALYLRDWRDTNIKIAVKNSSFLQDLDLDGIRLDWSSTAFANLRHLRLHGGYGSLPAVWRLSLLLRNTPLLEQFDLEGWSVEDDEGLSMPEQGTFEIKQLVQLDLDAPRTYLRQVLQSLRFPALNLAAFGWRDSTEFPNGTDPTHAELMTLVAQSTMPPSFNISVDSSEKTLELGSDDIMVWITLESLFRPHGDVDETRFYKMVDDFMEAIQHQSFTLASTHLLTEWETNNNFISDTPLSFQEVTFRPISSHPKRYWRFVAALRTLQSGTPQPRWMFPNLSILCIYFMNEFTLEMGDALLDALQTRKSLVSGVGPEGNNLSLRFRKVELVGPIQPDRQLMWTIRGSMEGGSLKWSRKEPVRSEHGDYFSSF